jgi:hypothetical protein
MRRFPRRARRGERSCGGPDCLIYERVQTCCYHINEAKSQTWPSKTLPAPPRDAKIRYSGIPCRGLSLLIGLSFVHPAPFRISYAVYHVIAYVALRILSHFGSELFPRTM